MFLEGTLLEKLRKIEALHAGTTVAGEREANDLSAAVRQELAQTDDAAGDIEHAVGGVALDEQAFSGSESHRVAESLELAQLILDKRTAHADQPNITGRAASPVCALVGRARWLNVHDRHVLTARL